MGGRKSHVRFAMFVHLSAIITAASTRRISVKFGIWNFNEKSVEKFQILLKSVKNIGRFTRRCKYVLFFFSLRRCFAIKPLSLSWIEMLSGSKFSRPSVRLHVSSASSTGRISPKFDINPYPTNVENTVSS